MAALPTGAQATAPSSTSTPLTLGAVTFATEECPETLAIGGIEQIEQIVELAGGGRVVQDFGGQFKPVSWRGRFFAASVATKVPILQSYAASGREMLLTWGRERYYCTVKDFVPPYRHANLADYEITVTITRDANGVMSNVVPTTLDAQVGALSNSANVSAAAIAAADASAPAFTPSLTNLQIAISSATPLAQASAERTASVIAAVKSALTLASTYLGGLSSSSSTTYITATQLVNLLTLIQTNIGNGQAQRTISLQGGSLYETAAMLTGDIAQAFGIASLNGLASPALTRLASTEVRVPPQTPARGAF